MKKYIYILLLILAAPLGLRTQTGGGNWAGVVFKSSSGGAVPAPGATITVCSTATVLVNGVCPAQENDANCCFTDASLTVHLNGGAPFTADARGNVSFWGIAGTYQLTVSGTGISAYTTNVQVACTPGAIGCGLQTGTVNTFTAQQNFDANVANKGPNPWADVTRFGGYFGTQTPPSTTGAITTGTPALVLANAQDFANGQGVLVLGAGPATSLSTPTGVVAAPWGVTGSTTDNYCVVAEDYLLGRTACSAAGPSTTSVATLGVQTATNVSYTRVAGLVTITTSAPHNFTAGAQFNMVKGMSGVPALEGAFTILTTPSPTTFTYTQYGFPDASGSLAGTSQVVGINVVKWNSDASNTVLRSHIYRCTATCTLPANAANYAYAGTVVGVDGYFQDYGLAVTVGNVGNGDVPATAPTTATNTALSTTILSGGGTTALTLANNAGSTVAGATVLHDNSPNLVAACSSFTRGGIVYIPNSNIAANWFPIKSPFKLSSCPGGTQLQINNKVFANAPIIMSANQNIQGLPGGRDTVVANAGFYDLRPQALIAGFGYPLIYIPPSANNISLDDLLWDCNQTYQPCIYQDQLTTSGSIAGARYRHVHTLSTSGNNTTWVVKGGFGFYWEYGGWQNSAASFASPPAMVFSANCGLGNTGQQQAYLVTMQSTYNFGGIQVEYCNQPSVLGMNVVTFRDMIMESGAKPMFRFANTGGGFGGNISFWEIVRPTFADASSGQSTPLIDATTVTTFSGLHIVSPSGQGGALLETNSGAVNGMDISADFNGIVGAQFYTIPGLGNFSNVPAKASGTLGHFAYQMALPSPPQSAVVSAGGSVPVGAHAYTVAAVDFSGNETTLSTGVTATATGGNQTVTVTLPASFPSGAKGVNVYRDGNRANNGSCGTNPQFTTPGGTFADTSNVTCGFSPASANNAGASLVDANGLTTSQLRLTGSNNIVGHPDFGGVIGGFFQINSVALAAQDIFNLMPDASTSGITCENTLGGGQVRCHLTATAGGGTFILACTLTSPAQKQILAFDGSSICKNANPAVLTTDKATVNTTSYTLVALDLGNDILRKAAGAMTDTWPQGGSAGFPIGWYGLLCNTDTVNSDTATPTTSTVNGQANIVITPNTCGHMIVDPANNWRFHGFNWIVPGGGLQATYNANGSTSLSIIKGTATLGTSAIASATCATVVTVADARITTTMVISAGFNGDPTAVTGYVPLTTGMLTIIPYPTAGNANFKVCNNTSASITPGAITLNWTAE